MKALGELELDCRVNPPPLPGEGFNLTVKGKTVRAVVGCVVKYAEPIKRSEGIVDMVATHKIRFAIP